MRTNLGVISFTRSMDSFILRYMIRSSFSNELKLLKRSARLSVSDTLVGSFLRKSGNLELADAITLFAVSNSKK